MSNMSSRVNYNAQYVPLNGKCLDEVMTPQQIAQLLIVAENNVFVNEKGEFEWKREGSTRKYTPPHARTSCGGWTQEGLDRYHAILERERNERRNFAISFKGQQQDRPDYLSYQKVDKEAGKRKRGDTAEKPNAEDVAVGIDDSELNMLGNDIDSDVENDATKAVDD